MSAVAAAPPLLVVTPTLGTSPYLGEAVRSVQAAGVPARHLLVCPEAQCASLRERFPDCTVIGERGASAGPYAALNRGLAAGGDWRWFTVINDDDRAGRGLTRLIADDSHAAEAEEIVYGDLGLIGERGEVYGPLAVERNPRRFGGLWRSGIVPMMQPGTLVGRRVLERLGGFDERYRLSADLDFWVRAFTSGVPFRYRRAHVADFRLRRGQLSANTAAVAGETDAIVAGFGPPTTGAARLAIRTAFRVRNAGRFAERLVRTGHVRAARLYGSEGGAPDS